MAARRFPSKVDRWLVIFIGAMLVLELFVVIYMIRAGAGPLIVTFVLMVTVGFFLFVGLTLSRTYYVIDQRLLRITCGVFFWSIPLKDIHSVEPSRSPLSSPALSLDRLRVRYGNGKSILVSPADKVRFVKALGLGEAGDGGGDRGG